MIAVIVKALHIQDACVASVSFCDDCWVLKSSCSATKVFYALTVPVQFSSYSKQYGTTNLHPPAANVLGTIGTVFWCIQLVPQIWYNWKQKKTDGLPGLMMFLWAICMDQSFPSNSRYSHIIKRPSPSASMPLSKSSTFQSKSNHKYSACSRW